MKKLGLVAFAFALLLGNSQTLLGATPPPADPGRAPQVTERRVHGVITAIEPAKLTIASSQHAVTGKLDPSRTKITVNGHPGKITDLQLTAHAKGELCLDDVWLAIDTH